MPEHKKGRRDGKTDTKTLESKLKNVTLDDRSKQKKPGSRVQHPSQAHQVASKKLSQKQKVQDYLYQNRINALSKTSLPRFLYSLAAEQQSRGPGYGSSVPGSSSAGFPQFGLGGSFPAGPGPGAPGQGGRGRNDLRMPMPTDAEAFSMTSYNANYIDGIQIWQIRSNGELECLKPGQPRFDIMAAAIMLGFDIMESKPWRKRMKQHANTMFAYIQDVKRLPLPPGRIRSDDAVQNYSEDFIRRCRQNSPVAILHDLGNSQWARTLKADWSGRGYFNAQMAATVEYNLQIIDRIDGVAKRYMDAKRLARRYADERKDQHSERERRHAKDYLKRYHSMIARVGITVAHEMEHVFTGYLLKDPKTHTPPPVTYGGFGTYAFGESGRYMEGDVFGGFLDMKYELSSDMEVNAVRTYSQTFILSYDQVNAIIKRQWNILPTYDPEGDSYRGPPQVTPPKKVDLEKWRDENRYRYLLSGRDLEPELNIDLLENLRRGLYGGRQYRLKCESLRDFSEDPRTHIVELGSSQVILA